MTIRAERQSARTSKITGRHYKCCGESWEGKLWGDLGRDRGCGHDMLGQTEQQQQGWIEQCFTSPPTQYRLYGRRFLQVRKTQPTVSKYWRYI